jgi:hypothetical protein
MNYSIVLVILVPVTFEIIKPKEAIGSKAMHMDLNDIPPVPCAWFRVVPRGIVFFWKSFAFLASTKQKRRPSIIIIVTVCTCADGACAPKRPEDETHRAEG